MNVEVILSAYNNVKDLNLVLHGYLQQIDNSFSICIADDGSRKAVKDLAILYKGLGLNIRHIWQEDKGFRKAKILNKSIESSQAEYIILTDSDCIPSKYFIADYKELLRPNTLVIGRRVDLFLRLSEQIRNNIIYLSKLDQPFWLVFQSLQKKLNRPSIAIRFPNLICRIWNKKERSALGANMGIAKKDLIKVNGFDADFEGYGLEETDLEWRLLGIGVTRKSALGRIALFHLYHPEKKMIGDISSNLITKKRKEGLFFCSNGIFSN